MAYDRAVFTEHARLRMARREIAESAVQAVLLHPVSDRQERPGRRVLQGRIQWGSPPQPYLLRVFVASARNPPEVVTVYQTRNFSKVEAAP